MVKRRKMLIGLGTLAAGGAAAVGTSAFTSSNVERDVEVDVADDSNAFVGLEATNSNNADEFVTENNGVIGVKITDTNAGGQGINQNGTTVFDDLFTVTNMGTSDVWAIIRDDTPTTANSAFYAQLDGNRVLFQDGNRSSGTYLDSTLPTVVKIPVGNSVTVGFEQDEPNTGSGYDESVTVVASDNLDDVGDLTQIDASGQFGPGRGQDLKDLNNNRLSPP